MSHHPVESGDAWPLPGSGMGDGGCLRDAGWLPAPQSRAGGESAGRTQRLYRWNLPAGASGAGLVFEPLDGNPRHGVLALFLPGRAECHGVIEILERQGRWMLMPDRGRARLLGDSAAARRGDSARRAGRVYTPDRRYVFFNVQQDGGMVAVVERRQTAAPSPAFPSWPR